MKRNISKKIIEWKDNGCKKPLFLFGIKGVGKTYSVYDFARTYFNPFFYLNFENNKKIKSIINGSTEDDIIDRIAVYFDVPAEMIHEGLLILDEVYFGTDVYKILISKCKKQKINCIFVSSYDFLTGEDKKDVEYVTMYPLQFDEYLIASGYEKYADVLTAHVNSKKKLPDIVHNELLSIFDEYLWVGGMPKVVNEYMNLKVPVNVLECQHEVFKSELEFIKKISYDEASRCINLYEVIEKELNESRYCFKFSMIRAGLTEKMYIQAIDLLTKNGLLYKINNLSSSNFKLFFPEFSFLSIAADDELTASEKKLRYLNYMIQTLYQNNRKIYSWKSKGIAFLDTVEESSGEYIAIDLVNEDKKRSKSLFEFLNSNDLNQCSSLVFSNENVIDGKMMPLYAIDFYYKNNEL